MQTATSAPEHLARPQLLDPSDGRDLWHTTWDTMHSRGASALQRLAMHRPPSEAMLIADVEPFAPGGPVAHAAAAPIIQRSRSCRTQAAIRL